MSDYVVYHNEEAMEHSLIADHAYDDSYGFVTNKDISKLKKGTHTIWMIEGTGRPRKYYLCQKFTVNPKGIRRNVGGDWKYEADGKSVGSEFYEYKIPLNGFDWFPNFLKRMANFSLGFTELKEDEVRNFREAILRDKNEKRLIKAASPSLTQPRQVSGLDSSPTSAFGQGFGDSETNPEVEQAAMEYVKKYYVSDGWKVKDESKIKNLGYDFLCKKKSLEKHVEVKGCRGAKEEFCLKISQKHHAETDDRFVLAVVTNALTKTPNLSCYTSLELFQNFELAPREYWAYPKSKNSVLRRGSR